MTGWRVPEVHWSGVRLSDLLDAAQPDPGATAISFGSFDGTYTESLTLDQARRSDVLVAHRAHRSRGARLLGGRRQLRRRRVDRRFERAR